MSNRVVSLSRLLLQKHFWVLQLLFLISMTLLGALAVTSFAEAYLAKYEVAVPEAHAETQPPADSEGEYLDLSLLFPGPAEPPIDNRADEPGSAPPVTEPRPQVTDCADSEIPALLVGTVADDDGGWSHGVVRDCMTNQTRIMGIGDEIGSGVAVSVERNRICFQIDDEIGCLVAGDPTPFQRAD